MTLPLTQGTHLAVQQISGTLTFTQEGVEKRLDVLTSMIQEDTEVMDSAIQVLFH